MNIPIYVAIYYLENKFKSLKESEGPECIAFAKTTGNSCKKLI